MKSTTSTSRRRVRTMSGLVATAALIAGSTLTTGCNETEANDAAAAILGPSALAASTRSRRGSA